MMLGSCSGVWDVRLLSPDIEPVAKSMAGRCDGLPLGLITLGGSMRGVTDIREWKYALQELSDDMESDVFKVLQYSYDRLKDKNLCAWYLEDFVIDRDELIGRFIMAGLVKRNCRQEEFNHGHTILNKLVKLCLLEGITELCIINCARMKKLFCRALLHNVQNLNTLQVLESDEMEEIIAEEATDQEASSLLGTSSNPRGSSTSSDILILPNLKVLHLRDLPELKRICGAKLICDSLEFMSLDYYPELRRLHFCTSTTNGHPFSSLRRIEVEESYVKSLF
ncbi:hypothetical protein K7X08_021899 [Anisodus acutangulus]|uniref:Disease resistance protein At4g27190-like leucine-rich repeats domain-containing protein n=1 Tax=Anisodus acutangulus TaxID=402998 RepID=A0A9Q1L2V9_9SOLA|nr:hypothetical protein K7X08_021899 [Anisodus acutangulus]